MSCRQLIQQVRLMYTVSSSYQTCICGAICRKFNTSAALGEYFKPKVIEQLQKRKDLTHKKRPKQKQKKQMIPIYKNMTVEELSVALNKEIDVVFDALRYASPGSNYRRQSPVSNYQVLQKVVQLSGYVPESVARPEKIKEKETEDRDVYPRPPPDPSVLVRRPPVVTIMGHVDHGKTTLLDALRKTNVVAQEFGGITQHIGAFSVQLASGETITFLDTPGHAAFSSMRARGASVTDIVILVVAADDGVMPTTVESIRHAMNAKVPVIVAINKIDTPGADIEKAERMLLQYNITTESLGGDVQCVPISALKRTNLQQLQEAIITQAEIMDIKGDPTGMVEGHVIESKTDPGRGKLATIIVERGTLKKGDLILAGMGWAKVRGIYTDKGTALQTASLSTPVEVLGWRDLPLAGDQILQVKSEKILREALEWRRDIMLKNKIEKDQEIIDEKREKHNTEFEIERDMRYVVGHRAYRKMRRIQGFFRKQSVTEVHHEGPSLSVVLKGDVNGSVEAILNTLVTYSSRKCRLDLIHHGIGEVTLNDVETAQLFNGEVFAFNVPVPNSVKEYAISNDIVIHEHNVIYQLFDQLIESLRDKLPIIEEEENIGEADVLEIFSVTQNKNKVQVAGCRCTSGLLQRKQFFKLVRDEEEIFRGTLSSLKHHKNEVDIIKKDSECGISLSDNSIQYKRGDVIVCYKIIEIQPEIDWDPGF